MLVEVLPDYEALSDRAAAIVTIMEARQLLLLASGAVKAQALKSTLEGPVTAMCPATIVQMHRFTQIILDEEAASALSYRHHKGIMEPKA